MKNMENKTENNNPIKFYIMKKIILIVCGIVFNLTLLAQPPQGINYQAVVRNSLGEIVSNQTVNFKFHLRIGSETGAIMYTETQDILTDQYGLANLVIGNGTPVTGTFEGIDWKDGNIWIEVEMDPANTHTYVSMGAEQFQSVPYALYSGSDWNATSDNLYYNDGNVGIGTDAPTEKLEVVGNVFVNNNDVGVEQSIFLGPSSPTVSIGREAGSRTMLLKTGVDGMATGAGFKFLIADEDKMILDEDGNVGIGTVIPGARLHVAGNIRLDGGRLEVFNTGQSVFIGEGAGANDDLSDNENVAVGNYALTNNTEGYWNTASGNNSLYSNTTGYANIAIGFYSLYHNTTGFKNTAYGSSSLSSNMTGIENTAIGFNADVGSAGLINATAIGANALVTQSNSLVLGSIAGINGASSSVKVGIGTTSPTQKLDVNGNMRLAGSLYDANNEPGTSGQVLSSTGSGEVAWASPYPAWAAAEEDSEQTFPESDDWRTLCSVTASDFEEGHKVKLEANMMLRLDDGMHYDEFFIQVEMDCSGTKSYSTDKSFVPDNESTAHDYWQLVSFLDIQAIPGPGIITFSLQVRNVGDDVWKCKRVDFIATQMD